MKVTLKNAEYGVWLQCRCPSKPAFCFVCTHSAVIRSLFLVWVPTNTRRSVLDFSSSGLFFGGEGITGCTVKKRGREVGKKDCQQRCVMDWGTVVSNWGSTHWGSCERLWDMPPMKSKARQVFTPQYLSPLVKGHSWGLSSPCASQACPSCQREIR